jgi:hypothetical protein
MVKLKEKEEQLQEKNHANQVDGYHMQNFCLLLPIIFAPSIQELLAELEKARAVQATPGTGKLKAELAIAHKTVGALQKAFWFANYFYAYQMISIQNF